LMEYLNRLEKLAYYSDLCAGFLKETHPGKSEALRDRIHSAITSASVLNACKPQQRP
jgi:hypothetical protein